MEKIWRRIFSVKKKIQINKTDIANKYIKLTNIDNSTAATACAQLREKKREAKLEINITNSKREGQYKLFIRKYYEIFLRYFF